MNKLLIIASLAAIATATPALADRGHGNGHGDRNDNNQQGDRNDNGHGDRNDNRQGDHREGWGTYGAWGNNCPPGLAKKHNGCMPPGQARRHYNTGQRWSGNGTAWSYNQIPYQWRQQYNLNANDRYYYRDGYLYRVNRRTNLVEQVLSAILR